MKRLLTILTFALLTFAAKAAVNVTEISGQVFLKDSPVKPGDYVMVYVKELGTGTLSDEQGNYTLRLPAAGGKKVSVEYSRIGYEAATVTYELPGGRMTVQPVYMEVQTLMLTAAYVIPDGRSPGEYVLSKVWENSKKKKGKSLNYRAEISYNLSTHDLPVVAQALPKAAVGAGKVYAAVQGYGPLVRYCLNHDDFSAKVALSRQVKDGQSMDFANRLLWSDQKLPENVKKNVTTLFEPFDLYELMYGESNAWGEKWSKKHKFKLAGTYEYGDYLVDVLKYTDHRGRVTATVHVVEDLWTIMKIQLYTKEGEVLRIEARDIGNGVWMPISMVLKPSVSMIRAEQIPAVIESIERDKNIPKGSAERMIEVLKAHEGQDFNPYIAVSGNVRYRLL